MHRWEELNSFIIQAEIDAGENSDETDLKEYGTMNGSEFSRNGSGV